MVVCSERPGDYSLAIERRLRCGRFKRLFCNSELGDSCGIDAGGGFLHFLAVFMCQGKGDEHHDKKYDYQVPFG